MIVPVGAAMADWSGVWCTNWFKVRDFNKFAAHFLAGYGEQIDYVYDTEKKRVRLFCPPDCDGNFPSVFQDFEKEVKSNFDDLDDFIERLYPHLDDHEVAVIMQAGNEKINYISGLAVAVNYAGMRSEINLWDIMDKARMLTAHPHEVTDPSHF